MDETFSRKKRFTRAVFGRPAARIRPGGLHIGIEAVALKGREVLLGKRDHDQFSGHWCIVADWLDYGEHPEECVRRALREQFGVAATRIELTGVDSFVMGARSGHWHLFFYYRVEIVGVPVPGRGNSEVGLFPIESLPPGVPAFMAQRVTDAAYGSKVAGITPARGIFKDSKNF